MMQYSDLYDSVAFCFLLSPHAPPSLPLSRSLARSLARSPFFLFFYTAPHLRRMHNTASLPVVQRSLPKMKPATFSSPHMALAASC
jgi:hypothetical protein